MKYFIGKFMVVYLDGILVFSRTKEEHLRHPTLVMRRIQQEKLFRKTGPWSNKIKQMQKQNTEDTQYNRDTDLRGSPSVGYVHQRNCQVLPLLLSII
jgi:hypothetical protein